MSGQTRREHLAVLACGAAYLTGCARSHGAAKIALPEINETVLAAHFTGDHNNTTYNGVRFANCTFRHTQFDACTFINCGFDDCDFEVAEFSRSTFDNCVFLSGTFEQGIFLDNTMRTVTFGGVHMIRVGFDGGNLQHLTLRDCRIEHVALKGLKLTNLEVVDCHNAEHLNLTTSEIQKASITDTNLRESSVYRCEIHDFDCRNGHYALLRILESTLTAPMFQKVRFAGFNLSDSSFEAPLFEDCTFDTFLVAKHTKLQQPRFVRPLVTQGMRLKTEGMTSDGDKLPGT